MKTQPLRPANRAKIRWFAAVAALAMIASSRAAAVHDAGPVLTEATDLAGAVMFLESHAPGMILVAIRGDGPLP